MLHLGGVNSVNATLIIFAITVCASIAIAFLYKTTLGIAIERLSRWIMIEINNLLKLDSDYNDPV